MYIEDDVQIRAYSEKWTGANMISGHHKFEQISTPHFNYLSSFKFKKKYFLFDFKINLCNFLSLCLRVIVLSIVYVFLISYLYGFFIFILNLLLELILFLDNIK